MDIVQRVEELIAQHAEVAMVATAHIHILPRLILLYGGNGSGSSGGSGGRSSSSSKKPRWSSAGSSVAYTSDEIRSLTPIRETVETRAAEQPDLRDVFLCHAWDDRKGAAKELHDLLEAEGVKVWFSEKDLGLGIPDDARN